MINKLMLTIVGLSMTALIVHAQIPDSDITDYTGNVVGHIHYHYPDPPPPVYDSSPGLGYWMNYYSRVTQEAEMQARQNVQALRAQQAQEWATMRREARDGWYSVSRDRQVYWENVVPGVREAVKRGDYMKVFNLIGDSPQFKRMRSAQEKK